jgi:hypothetical protein
MNEIDGNIGIYFNCEPFWHQRSLRGLYGKEAPPRLSLDRTSHLHMRMQKVAADIAAWHLLLNVVSALLAASMPAVVASEC